MKRDVLEKLSELMTAAFGLVAALAWNDAIKSLFLEGGPNLFCIQLWNMGICTSSYGYCGNCNYLDRATN